jgi:hypothetical protein
MVNDPHDGGEIEDVGRGIIPLTGTELIRAPVIRTDRPETVVRYG